MYLASLQKLFRRRAGVNQALTYSTHRPVFGAVSRCGHSSKVSKSGLCSRLPHPLL